MTTKGAWFELTMLLAFIGSICLSDSPRIWIGTGVGLIYAALTNVGDQVTSRHALKNGADR